jgi:rSAM/selenodomain-associated transferase 2
MLSVIIPTLNAGATLECTLGVVAESEMAGEIVVVDGGSTDESIVIAGRFEAIVISSEAGRGQQLAVGAAAARGDWLLFLHGDSVLQAGWKAEAGNFIRDESNAERAGYFTLRYDDPRWRARSLERFVAWRSRAFGLPYGDQGLLLSREFYERLGGFKAIPIMEDVEFVRRIGKRSLVALSAIVETSARRYRRSGYILRMARNFVCLSLFFFGLAPKKIARIYERNA